MLELNGNLTVLELKWRQAPENPSAKWLFEVCCQNPRLSIPSGHRLPMC